MISQLFDQSQGELLREVNTPGWLLEQTVASRPWPSLSSTGSPISCSGQSILFPACQMDTCVSVLPVTPPACCCEKRRTSASPPCQRFFAAPSTALAKKKHIEGRQSGEPREMLSHAQTAANLLGTRGYVRTARTCGLLGSTVASQHPSLEAL